MNTMPKEQRKLQDKINGILKRFPGKHRLWELDRIGDELRIEAEIRSGTEEAESLARDALLINRLAWDLLELRDMLRGSPRRENAELSRLDPANWKGPRP